MMTHDPRNQNVRRLVDSRDFAIGVLSVTAVILLVGVILVGTQGTPALASGMSVSAGEYVLTVGQAASVDEEFLYVFDGPSDKFIAYRFNTSRQQIDVVQGVDLSELRDAAGQQQGQPAGQKPPTRGRRRP